MEGKDGLILQGCGGDAQEWVDGINEMFTEAGILKDGSKFKDVSTFQYGELTCLLYPFEDVKLEIGKLAMWHLAFRLCAEPPGRIYRGACAGAGEARLCADRPGWEYL